MRQRFLMLGAALAIVPACASCAGDTPTMPASASETASFAAMPGEPGSARDRDFYKAKLDPAPGVSSRGMLQLDVVGGFLRVRVHGVGLEPGMPIPQHIHVNSGCNPGGAVLINLDAGLTVPGEGPGVGPAYPVASAAGIVDYEATRSLADLRAALNTFAGTTLADDAALLAYLDLENRNGHMHVAFGPPFPAVNCGAMEQVN